MDGISEMGDMGDIGDVGDMSDMGLHKQWMASLSLLIQSYPMILKHQTEIGVKLTEIDKKEDHPLPPSANDCRAQSLWSALNIQLIFCSLKPPPTTSLQILE